MILRGAQVSSYASAADIQVLSDAGVNLIRYQIAPFVLQRVADWRKHVTEHSEILRSLKATFPDITWVADLHRAPPGSLKLGLIHDAWAEIIRITKVKHVSVLNEPPFRAPLTEDIMNRIGRWANASGLQPILTFPRSDPPHFRGAFDYADVPGAWYDVHMWLPFRLTHQGVFADKWPPGEQYPKGLRLHKQKLKKLLEPVRDFQKLYNVPIYLSEFGCSTFADDFTRADYIKDVIDIAEEYGWHWTVHAFREAEVWNLETETVWTVLKKAWSRNRLQ